MGDGTWKALSVLELVAFAVLVAVSVVLGGCPDPIQTAAGGTVPMKCNWSFAACKVVGCAGAVCAVCSLVAHAKEGRRVASVLVCALALACAVLPTSAGIGICAMEGMHCHTTAAVVWACAAVALVCGIAGAVKANPAGVSIPKMQL